MALCWPTGTTRRPPGTEPSRPNSRCRGAPPGPPSPYLIRIGAAAATTAATSAGVVDVVIAPATATIPQAAAVGEHDVVDAADRVLRLRLVHVDGDHVSRRHRRLRPANQAERRWTAEFGSPMHRLAVLTLHVEFEDRVRVRPRELRNRGVLQNRDRSVVRGVAVMGERGRRNRQKTREDRQRRQRRFHDNPFGILYLPLPP